jgi:hypothetical protein
VSFARPIAIAIGLIALATTAQAHAATTRADYAAQANPVCQSAERPVGKAIAAYFKAVRRKGIERPERVTEKTVGPTIRFGRWIAGIYTNVTARLRLIPPAPGDESTVSTWLQDRDAVATNLDGIVRAYKKRKFAQGRRLDRAYEAAIAEANTAGRPLGLQVECTPHDGVLFEFDPAN